MQTKSCSKLLQPKMHATFPEAQETKNEGNSDVQNELDMTFGVT